MGFGGGSRFQCWFYFLLVLQSWAICYSALRRRDCSVIWPLLGPRARYSEWARTEVASCECPRRLSECPWSLPYAPQLLQLAVALPQANMWGVFPLTGAGGTPVPHPSCSLAPAMKHGGYPWHLVTAQDVPHMYVPLVNFWYNNGVVSLFLWLVSQMWENLHNICVLTY